MFKKNSFLLFFFQDIPGIRTRTIALHASPDTLRIHTNSSKLLHVMILHLKALFEFCGQLFVASHLWWYGTGQVRSRVIRQRLPPWWPRHKKHRDVIHFSILLGIRTRTIALHALPNTLRIHTHSSKLLHVMILHLKALFEYCGQLFVASCLWWYGTVRDRYGIAPGVTHTNKQTNT